MDITMLRAIFIKAVFGALGCFSATSASAYMECAVTVSQYYVGDDGSLWVSWQQGGAGLIRQSDPDFKPTLATVMLGLISSRSLTVRYDDGNSCTGLPIPIIGLWIR